MAALLFNVSRSTFANNYTSKMYKTVKTQTNLPVKICHLKVYSSFATNSGLWKVTTGRPKVMQTINLQTPARFANTDLHSIREYYMT